MSLPDLRKSKPAKAAKPASPAEAAKPAKAAEKSAAAAKRAKTKSDEGYSNQDKAHFVKAMWEGVKSDEAASSINAAPKVEILRKIPAQVTPETRKTPESFEALSLAAQIEAKLAAGDLEVLTPEALQALMAALCKLYGANVETGNKYPILSGRAALTGTDAMIACGGLLKAVDLQVFELGMWQSWSGL